MKFTRRDALALGLGAAAASILPLRALASTPDEFTGGAAAGEGGITLTAPKLRKTATRCQYLLMHLALLLSPYLQQATRHRALQHSTLAHWQAANRRRHASALRERKMWLLLLKWLTVPLLRQRQP